MDAQPYLPDGSPLADGQVELGPGATDTFSFGDPQATLTSGAALIRIDVCGVCGTDLHILRGHWPKPLPWTLTLGHELAGVIEEKEPGLKSDFMEQHQLC